MSAERRLCPFAAVNIDGQSSRNVRRANDNWSLDPRIPQDAQIGNELYVNNDLDRGHMVRRLDPVWGDDFKQANDETFFYTNSTPQHGNLNQKTWNDLEDYVLDNTKAHDLRVCVFTGPVFADDDPVYRDVRLPQQFWKVVTVVNGDTNTLHTTAYILSQKDMLNDLEFVFGQFRTYQLPIAVLEEKTQLSFGKLVNFDPLKQESVFPIREISRLEEVVL
jgi:endonuclease G